MTDPVRLLEQRRYDPPRKVLVELEGQWWHGYQDAWRLCDDGRGWMASVEFVARYDWGPGKHLMSVRPERVQLVDAENADQPPGYIAT
jgi:hypothetical protein